MGPGFFSDIGRRTRDLLNKDFQNDQKITVTSSTLSGLTFVSSGTKKGEMFNGDVATQFKNRNITVDVKVDTGSSLHTKITADEISKNTKAVFSFSIPDEKSGKIEVSYVHELCGVNAGISLSSTPVADLSVAVGNDAVAVGGDISFDSSTGTLARCGGGIALTKPDFSAAVLVADKGDTIKASYSHIINAESKTTIGAEIAHKFSLKENTLTLGGLYVLDPATAVKGRLDNHGKFGGLLQHEWRPKSLVTLSAEMDTRSLERHPRIGLAIALKP